MDKSLHVLDLLIVSSLQLESRVESIDVQLSKLNTELANYQQRLSKMRDGPGKNAIKQKVYIPLPLLLRPLGPLAFLTQDLLSYRR